MQFEQNELNDFFGEYSYSLKSITYKIKATSKKEVVHISRAPNNACQKWGQDVLTSATTHYQIWFGLTRSNLIGDFNHHISKLHCHRQKFFKTPACGNAELWAKYLRP